MRKHDKIKNIQKVNLLIEQMYLSTKKSGVIYEDFNLMTEEGTEMIPNLSKVKNGIEQAGGSLSDKDTQLALLDKFIDSDFDISKVNPQAVVHDSGTENNNLTESHDAGGVTHLIHQAHTAFDHTENGAKILDLIHKYISPKITKESIMKGLHVIEKILNFVPNLFAKAIYKLMRYFGAGLETARIGSYAGPVLWIALLAAISIWAFPSIMSAFASVAGIMTLLYKLWNLGSAVWSGVKKVIAAFSESADKVVTVVDLLDELEKGKGLRFEYDEIKELEEWYNHLKEDGKTSVTKIMTQMIEYIHNGKSFGGHLELLSRFHFPEEIIEKIK